VEQHDLFRTTLRRGGGPGIRPPIQPLPNSLELFSRTRFSGDRRLFSTEQSDLRRVGFNDVAQSLRLGRGQAWEVCVDIDFGNCRVVNSDWQQLSRLGISRRISSVRPWRQGGGGRGGGQTYVVLFDNRGYRGRSFRVDSAAAVLSGFANRAESIQVSGGAWQLCERSSFGGRCVVVSGNMTDLSAIGLRNRVASVRPVLDRAIARSRDEIAASLDHSIVRSPNRAVARSWDRARVQAGPARVPAAQAPAPLVGTVWRAIELVGKPTSSQDSQREAHLLFQEGGRVSGSDGCNYLRSYVMKAGHLFLALMADGGIYEFEPRPAQLPSPTPET
jgi:hypothetical protein